MPAATKSTTLLIVLFALIFSAVANAKNTSPDADVAGWQTVVSDYDNAPSFLIAVDKKEQQLAIFERKSPLVKMAAYTITTGQNHGDKLIEGDLKTPEGVYFVVKYINTGLDYAMYGTEAYPLNYPNPVDRLRKKTGHGIWIHGKGIPLVPFDSNGCVGMNNNDILQFKDRSIIGSPVTLAFSVLPPTPEKVREKAATSALLASNVQAWAAAWSNRSSEMFDYYDQAAYAEAQGESFSSFRAQKERLFKALPWIKTTVSDIQTLEGPGYWVTWFNQDYEAPNLKSWGTRRLYWQPDAEGRLRIVGMEWLKNFKSPTLYADAASKNPQATVSDAPEAQPAQVVAATAQPAKAAQPEPEAQVAAKAQPAPAAEPAPAEQTTPPAQPTMVAQATPATQPAPAAHVTPEPKPAKAEQPAPAAKPEEPALVAAAKAPEQKIVAAAPGTAGHLAQEQQDIEQMLTAEAREFINEWAKAWREQNLDKYIRNYADKASQDARKGKNWIRAQKKDLWSRIKVIKLEFTDIHVITTENGLKATMLQKYQDSTGYSDTGRKTLYLQYDQAWRIIREEWSAVK